MSTVSHVINDSHYVSDDIKNRIIKSMKDLNYNPNLVARSLRSKKSNTIGIILPEISDMWVSELVRNIESMLSLNKYGLILKL